MRSKLFILIIAFALIFFMWIYFLLNPSYDKSIRAKYYYEMGEYKEALSLAKEAFSLDIYNRMASTVMAQSLIAMKYVAYLEMAKKYMETINEIATHDVVSDADKARIRLICQIMTSSYVKLAPSVITDKDLIQDTAKYNDGFEKLLEKINK